MRARIVSSVVASCLFVAHAAHAEPGAASATSQANSCPTVLPVAEGERSIVVPSAAPNVAAPHVASLPQPAAHEANKTLLRDKLAKRDELQREIAALRESTQTPEQISVTIKMVEVNRTKLRKLSVDWATQGGGKLNPADLATVLGVESKAATSVPPTMGMCLNVGPAMLGLISALERHNISRVLASPTIVVVSGKPGALHVGREIPSSAPSAPGGVRTLKTGTQVDLTADAVGDNRVRIRVRPRVSEPVGSAVVDQNGEPVPALSVRQLDTAFETEFGKTTILSGLVQERTEVTVDRFGRRSDEKQEIALMLIVTPQIVR